MKEKIKAKVKAKAAAVKAKCKGIKAKVKAKCKGKACAAALLGVALLIAGCMDTNPASRATATTYGDIIVKIGDYAVSNAVSVTIGDGSVASADSTGSTETQTATPTMSIPVRIDARYNDALAAATPASKSVLGSLGEGFGAVLDLMASKKDGKVNAKTNDGKDVVVECSGGQCSICEDCEYRNE